MTGRPPKIPRTTLEPMLADLRGSGVSCKVIAAELGYSHHWIRHLCSTWNIVFKHKRNVDAQQVQKLGSRYDGSGAPVGNTTSPAASGSETGQLPDKGIS